MAEGGRLLWLCLVMSVLLTQHTSLLLDVASLTMDPPTNIKISDLGHLGYMNIEWSPPSSLLDLADCAIRYELRYYNTYTERWTGVRTVNLSYQDQFDLEKPIQVRMRTLVEGACTNGKEVLGPEVEIVHTPEHPGVPGSRIRDFHCVYFNKEYMDCTWHSGSVDPPDSKHYLYYWHREMEETAECPEYIPSATLRKGCRFPKASLLEFSEFNVCVNGSSTAGALKPAFFSLEVQNKVKPVTVSDLQLLVENSLVQVQWTPPSVHVPELCLEYELEGTTESMDGRKWQWTNLTEETSMDFLWDGGSERNCFRVRSKVNSYCADEGFWSDWSRSECFPETRVEKCSYDPWNALALTGMLVIVVIAVLIFCLMLRKLWVYRKKQNQDLCMLYQEKVSKAIPPLLSPLLH